mmetsp:Transcript_127761/g.409062  ORF Transcript_127761/g.409062 Transcript_127761/m.409062 type:complete len:375 (+) Transcript_127761:3202-4326(+)
MGSSSFTNGLVGQDPDRSDCEPAVAGLAEGGHGVSRHAFKFCQQHGGFDRQQCGRRPVRPYCSCGLCAAAVLLQKGSALVQNHGEGVAAIGEQGEEPNLPRLGRGHHWRLKHTRLREARLLHQAQCRLYIAAHQLAVQPDVLQPMVVCSLADARDGARCNGDLVYGLASSSEVWWCRDLRSCSRLGAEVRLAVRAVLRGFLAEPHEHGAGAGGHRAYHLLRGARRRASLECGCGCHIAAVAHRRRNRIRQGDHALPGRIANGSEWHLLHHPRGHQLGRGRSNRGGQELVVAGAIQDVFVGQRPDLDRPGGHFHVGPAHLEEEAVDHPTGPSRLHRHFALQLGSLQGEARVRVVGEVGRGAIGRVREVEGAGLGL